MEISEKARPDTWNKVYEDVSCARRGERDGNLELKKKFDS